MTAPLLSRWRIRADELPDRLLNLDRPAPRFTLPGAGALRGFADLLGDVQEEPPAPRAEEEDAPFPLPAMLPEDVPGEASLFLDVDFGVLHGDRAVLTIDEITGSGEILVGENTVARFGGALTDASARLTAAPCMLAADLTDALRLGRRERITIRFDAQRPAGVPGAVFLRTTAVGFLSDVTVIPAAAQRAMTVRARIHAGREGRYILQAAPQPALPGDPLPAAREMTFALNPMESREGSMTLSMPGEAFVPGCPGALSALRVSLLYMEGKTAVPCDSALIAAGYPGRPAASYVPLEMQDLQQESEALAARLAGMHISSVSLPAPAPDCFYLSAARAGVGVRHFMPEDAPEKPRLSRHPCVVFDPISAAPPRCALSPEETAWQLCGMAGMPRTPDPDFTPAELLCDAAGRALNPADAGVSAVLDWLSAVVVRLRAEAARQGRFSGALCAPGQWKQPDIADALSAALAPLHLSALPLLGAWWTGTRFSASLEAFVPQDVARQRGALIACAVLEDENGQELARIRRPIRANAHGAGTPVGLIEAQLPDSPCVLTLTCRLFSGDTLLEETALPVYVGLRGPLEAAF